MFRLDLATQPHTYAVVVTGLIIDAFPFHVPGYQWDASLDEQAAPAAVL